MTEKCFLELMADTFESQGIKIIKNSDGWKKIVNLYHGKGKKLTMEF